MKQKLTNLVLKTALVLYFSVDFTVVFAGGEPEPFNLTEVAKDNYLHKGVNVDFEHPQHDDIANIGFIVGEECIAVIDTGGSVNIGQQLLISIREISMLPICYVINTHIHFDHILGNFAFLDENPRFVGHAQLSDAIEQNRDFFLNQFREDLGASPSKETIIGPDQTVDKTTDLDLGNRKIRLTAHQSAHSHSDLTVLDLETNTLWAGDLIFRERIPSLDGNLKGWLAVLKAFQRQQVVLTIPGHGSTSKDWHQAYSLEQDYLSMLLVDTRKAIANGLFLEEAIKFVGKNEIHNWLLHEQHHPRNVTKAFTELEWE